MRTSLLQMMASMPGPVSAEWPQGEPYAVGLSHGTMSLGLYAPAGRDPQQPHQQDELYIIHAGSGEIVIDGARHAFEPGDAFFVAAGAVHRFEHVTPGFAAWVVFWGPPGGE
jgi:mannose-6-phosphate isomerase-like protein (cupin superfamily)